MMPHLVRWTEKYGNKGLTVVDIDNGSIDSRSAVEDKIEEKKLPYTVIHDQGGKNCRTYGITGYPSAYLIGVDGKVLWEGFPNGDIETIEELIHSELKKVKSDKLKATGSK
jgi:hypothetical protein